MAAENHEGERATAEPAPRQQDALQEDEIVAAHRTTESDASREQPHHDEVEGGEASPDVLEPTDAPPKAVPTTAEEAPVIEPTVLPQAAVIHTVEPSTPNAPPAPLVAAQNEPSIAASRNALVGVADQIASALGVDSTLVILTASAVVALLLYRVIFRPVLNAALGGGSGVAGGAGKRRHTVLMVGLPSSGKTILLQQLAGFDGETGKRLASAGPVADTRTSMQPNTIKALGGQLTVVDYPGHRRLRAGVFPHLREASTLVVVIDAITIHDDRHEGAYAVAELLLSLLPSAEFYGVKKLVFVCAKRDDVTAYAAKAVRKLLEKAMAASLQSQQGDLGRVDAVVDAKGGRSVGVSAGVGRAGAGKRYVLALDEDGTFDFDEQLDIPVEFVEVGCDLSSGGRKEVSEKISVKSLVEVLTS